MSTLSVGLFTYSTLPRGSVVHTANLADALHDGGCDVTVYALDKDGRGFFRPLRARVVLVPASAPPATTAELVRVRATELADHLERVRPAHDVYHAEDCLSASGLLRVRARGTHLGLVRTVHHVETFEDPFLAECQRRSILDADLCLAVSDAAASDVLRTFGVRSERVTNGVSIERFAQVDPERIVAVARRFDVGPGDCVVLAVGGVEERKNTLGTLRAFARLRAAYPGARLWILGGATVLDHGAYRAAFDAELARLPPDARGAVHELGVVDDGDVPAIFRLASVLAFPSLHEGFGLAALEGLAAGLPVVASNAPPLTEFLDPSCAILVDPTSDADIVGGLLAALETSVGADVVAGAAPRVSRCRARRAAGVRRARAHSWSAAAALHLERYALLPRLRSRRPAWTS